MIDYNDGKWHGFNGGECPLHPDSVVHWVNADGDSNETTAGKLCWNDDESPVVAFRVIKEHKEPREFYARFLDRCDVWQHCSDEHPDAVRFREVTE